MGKLSSEHYTKLCFVNSSHNENTVWIPFSECQTMWQGFFFCAWFLWCHLILKTLLVISMIVCIFLEEIDAHKLIITKNAIIQSKLASLHMPYCLLFQAKGLLPLLWRLFSVISLIWLMAHTHTHTGTLLRLAKQYIVSSCYLIHCQAVTNKLFDWIFPIAFILLNDKGHAVIK